MIRSLQQQLGARIDIDRRRGTVVGGSTTVTVRGSPAEAVAARAAVAGMVRGTVTVLPLLRAHAKRMAGPSRASLLRVVRGTGVQGVLLGQSLRAGGGGGGGGLQLDRGTAGNGQG